MDKNDKKSRPFDIEEAFSIKDKNDYELFDTESGVEELKNIFSKKKISSSSTITIGRISETPLSAFIVDFLAPQKTQTTITEYLEYIKNQTIRDICRVKFTINGERIVYDTPSPSEEEQRLNTAGRCDAGTQTDYTFESCYKKLFPTDGIPADMSSFSDDTPEKNDNLNDLYAVLVLSSQGAFGILVNMIATMGMNLHLRKREKDSYVVNIIATGDKLQVTNTYYGEICNFEEDKMIPRANIQATITADIKPIPDISISIKITGNGNKADELLGENEMGRKLTKANAILGIRDDEPKKRSLFSWGRHGGRRTKRKRKNQTRKKTRRRSLSRKNNKC